MTALFKSIPSWFRAGAKSFSQNIYEHRMQLAIGFILSLAVGVIMTVYENDFEHRNDEKFEEEVVRTAFTDTGKEITKRERTEGYRRIPGYELLEGLELKSYDSRLRMRGAKSPSPEIIIVGYDQFSGKKLPEFPIPRSYHAKMVNKLKRAGAKVIAFDMRFDAYQPGAKEGDIEFAEACKKAKNVIVTGDIIEDELIEDSASSTPRNPFSTPFDELVEGVLVGFSRKPRDLDRFTRRAFTVFEFTNPNYKDVQFASLGALAVGMYKGIVKDATDLDGEETLNRQLLKGVIQKGNFVRRIPVLHYNRSADPGTVWHADQFLINYPGLQSTIKTVRYFEILTDDPEFIGGHQDQLRRVFENKIVFIGATWDLLRDIFSTPYRPEGDYPGVEIHASAAHTILTGRFLREAPHSWNTLAIFALGFSSVLLGVLMGGGVSKVASAVDQRIAASRIGTIRGIKVRVYLPTWLVLYLMLGVAPPVAIYYWLSYYLLAFKGIWVTIVYPVLGVMFDLIGVVALMFLTKELDKKKAIGRFERFVAPSVLDEILKHPGDMEALPKPRRVEATLIFTDLQGFTTLSEKNEAEVVVEVLNAYLTRMNKVVFNHQGTIDKYEGDAIMLIFGAPRPQADHAQRAVRCAIEMQEECTKFRNEECRKDRGVCHACNGSGVDPDGDPCRNCDQTGKFRWPDVYMRVGISSGEVIVGPIGGGDRSDYTAIGDTVNLAARLEPLNKQIGSWIMCSRQTYEYAQDIVIADYVPGVQVKGKTPTRAEVDRVKQESSGRTAAVCRLESGRLQRRSIVHIFRNGSEIFEGQIESLRRSNKEVMEVSQGHECEVVVTNFDDYQEGDEIQSFVDVFAIRGLRETGRRDHIWGEGADEAPKAPSESAIGVQSTVQVSTPEPAAAPVPEPVTASSSN